MKIDLVENKELLKKQLKTRSGHIVYFDSNLTQYHKDGVSYCFKFNLCLIADAERYKELGADKDGFFTVDRWGRFDSRNNGAFNCLDIIGLYEYKNRDLIW